MQDDVDDLSRAAGSAACGGIPALGGFESIPIPPREDVVTYDPEAEDEGLAGWRSPPAPPHPGVVHPG